MSNIDELVQKIRNLNLQQQQLVTNLVDEIASSDTSDTLSTRTQVTQVTRTQNVFFVSSNGAALSIGDKVRVLNTRKTGKHGDIATIVKFNRTLVAIQLRKNKSHTQRASKYLELVQ